MRRDNSIGIPCQYYFLDKNDYPNMLLKYNKMKKQYLMIIFHRLYVIKSYLITKRRNEPYLCKFEQCKR